MKVASFGLPGESRWASLAGIASRVVQCIACLCEMSMENIGVIFSDTSYQQQDAHLCERCAMRLASTERA